MYPSNALHRRKFIPIIGLFLALAWTIPAISAPDKRANAEALTHSLVGLNKAYQMAAPNAKSQALQKLIDATVERQALLAELIETDPGAVLRTAIPASIRKQMPADVQDFIEQRLELEGELEVLYEDYADGSHRLRHALKADSQKIALHFKSQPVSVLTGTPAKVSGVVVDEAMAVASGEDDVLILALDGGADGGTNGAAPAPVPDTFGEQHTLVILVNFQDNPVEPYTPQFAGEVIFGETGDFFLENSFGQTWLSGDVTGWHTIPVSSAICDGSIAEFAEQAAIESGFDLSNYSRLIYAFPQNACSFWGQATFGGTPSRAWLNGDLELELTGHELGHNLGLYHGHSLVCDDGTAVGPGSGSVDEDPWPNCAHLEYGDGVDIMGSSISGHYSAYQKERLGWLGYGSSPAITQVDSDGSFELSPYAAMEDGNPKALKILKAEKDNGYRTWYYLEYRQPVGFDNIFNSYYSTMDPGNVFNGVTVHVNYEGLDGNGLWLLDMTTETNTDLYTKDPALVAGQTFVDPDGIATITTNWTDAGGAMVSISLGEQACSRANPVLELSPGEGQWVEAGTPVVYTATLTNSDSTACTAANFDLVASVPVDWTADFADLGLTLGPNASATTTVTVTSPNSASDGFYDVEINAENTSEPAHSASGLVTYVVSNPVANHVPVAESDSVATVQDSPVVIDILANDSDPDGDVLSIAAVTQGSNGMVTINGDETVNYMPNSGFSGTDSFSYTVHDGNGGSATAAVVVTVVAAPSNQGPSAINDDVTIQEKSAITIDVIANDSDPDGDALSIASVTQGAKGVVTINANNTLTYTPAKRFKDDDSFSYTITDGAASATATVTITLQQKDNSGGGKGGGKPKK